MSPTKAKPASAYLKTKVMTAGSGELRLMLFDGAVRFAGTLRLTLTVTCFVTSAESRSMVTPSTTLLSWLLDRSMRTASAGSSAPKNTLALRPVEVDVSPSSKSPPSMISSPGSPVSCEVNEIRNGVGPVPEFRIEAETG